MEFSVLSFGKLKLADDLTDNVKRRNTTRNACRNCILITKQFLHKNIGYFNLSQEYTCFREPIICSGTILY